MARNLAIVVGINHYRLLDQPLRFAEQDAIAMRDYLKNEAGFEPIYLLSDNAPTAGGKTAQPFRSNLLMVLDQVAAKVRLQESDSLWFFFSGHGARQAEQDYLLLSDSYLGDLQETAISTDQIIRSLRKCGAGNLVMILDACRNRVKDVAKGIGSQTSELARQEGVISLFSCSPSQMSYEIPALRRGAFTYVLLEALKKDCKPQSATFEQLDNYLRKQLPKLNRKHNQPAQDPYLIAEPARKYHQLILPPTVVQPPPAQTKNNEIERLKAEAFKITYVVKDLDRAKQLWRQVNGVASSPEDKKLALDRIEEITQVQRSPQPPSLPTSDSPIIQQEPPKSVSPPPVESINQQKTVSQPLDEKQSKQPFGNFSRLIRPKNAVSPLFQQKKVSAFEINSIIRQRTVHQPYFEKQPKQPSSASDLQASLQSPSKEQPKQPSDLHHQTILWVNLLIIALPDGMIAVILALVAAPVWLWAVVIVISFLLSLAGSDVGSNVEAVDSDSSWISSLLWVGILALFASIAWAWAATEAGIVVGVLIGSVARIAPMVVAGGKLLKSFSRFRTFLILTVTSWLGLGLGWFGHWVFQQVSRGVGGGV